MRDRVGMGLLALLLAPPPAAPSMFQDGFETCDAALDGDADRLDDCTELALGTSRVRHDTDADGLPDGDEVLGTLDGLDLPALGVSALRRDVLVEADWLVGPECGPGFDRRLTEANVLQAQAAFAAAPLVNPDGSTGIHLIVDYGQGGLFTGGNAIVGADAFLAGHLQQSNPEFREVRAAHFGTERRGRFHYLVMAWRYNETSYTSSGNAEIGGDDLIVSLSCVPNADASQHKYTNTLLHELGHNLDLHHGGNNECNERPNYNSVMNYRYQLDGTDHDCDAQPEYVMGTYSTGALPDLDEQHLDEADGLCGTPIDWDGDKVIESDVTVDLNWEADRQLERCGGYLTTLHDFDDWSAMRFDVFGPLDGGAPVEEFAECTPL